MASPRRRQSLCASKKKTGPWRTQTMKGGLMKGTNLRRWTAALCIGMIALAQAQSLTTAYANRPKLGLGVAIGKEVYSVGEMSDPVPEIKTVDFPSIYIPIRIAPNIRVEPEIGFFRYSVESVTDQTFTLLLYGAGVFFLQNIGAVDLSWGVRFNLMNETYHVSGAGVDQTVKRKDTIYGPALGGEYFFTPNLSLGGEVQFNLMTLGELKFEGDGANAGEDNEKVKSKIMRTKPLVFVRWYFGKRG
jgi:hypothetical protein